VVTRTAYSVRTDAHVVRVQQGLDRFGLPHSLQKHKLIKHLLANIFVKTHI